MKCLGIYSSSFYSRLSDSQRCFKPCHQAQKLTELLNLTFMGTHFDTMNNLLDLVSAVLRLEGLTISKIIISSGVPALTPFLETGPHILPTLWELWLTTEWMMKILEWLQRHPHSYENLTKFTVRVKLSADVHIVAEFL